MKKLILLMGCVFVLVGCVSSKLPQYLSDESPYIKKFYTNFDNALISTRAALTDLGWTIVSESDPAIYESDVVAAKSAAQQVIIFTDIRNTPLFLGTRYAKMNLILREKLDGSTEIEIRYLTVNSLPMRNIESYKNESAANRIFAHISQTIEGKK